MDIPNFIQHPPSDTEMETAFLLALGLSIKQVAEARCLSKETIRAHAKALRYKFHAPNLVLTLLRMFALNYIPHKTVQGNLPPHWHRYIKH